MISPSEWHPFSIMQVPDAVPRAAFYAEAVSAREVGDGIEGACYDSSKVRVGHKHRFLTDGTPQRLFHLKTRFWGQVAWN